MSEEHNPRPLLAWAVIALIAIGIVLLAIPSLRLVGVAILATYWIVVVYHLQRSIWNVHDPRP